MGKQLLLCFFLLIFFYNSSGAELADTELTGDEIENLLIQPDEQVDHQTRQEEENQTEVAIQEVSNDTLTTKQSNSTGGQALSTFLNSAASVAGAQVGLQLAGSALGRPPILPVPPGYGFQPDYNPNNQYNNNYEPPRRPGYRPHHNRPYNDYSNYQGSNYGANLAPGIGYNPYQGSGIGNPYQGSGTGYPYGSGLGLANSYGSGGAYGSGFGSSNSYGSGGAYGSGFGSSNFGYPGAGYNNFRTEAIEEQLETKAADPDNSNINKVVGTAAAVGAGLFLLNALNRPSNNFGGYSQQGYSPYGGGYSPYGGGYSQSSFSPYGGGYPQSSYSPFGSSQGFSSFSSGYGQPYSNFKSLEQPLDESTNAKTGAVAKSEPVPAILDQPIYTPVPVTYFRQADPQDEALPEAAPAKPDDINKESNTQVPQNQPQAPLPGPVPGQPILVPVGWVPNTNFFLYQAYPYINDLVQGAKSEVISYPSNGPYYSSSFFRTAPEDAQVYVDGEELKNNNSNEQLTTGTRLDPFPL